MKHMRLHHVGIVMPSMDKARAFMNKTGLEEDYCEYVEAYKAYCLFTKSDADESPIEFVIPVEGVLSSYNNGKGGIHHIAYEVDDVEAIRLEFEGQGLKMLEEKAVPGAGGIIVNFLRPRYGEGILTEYVQQVGPRP